MNLRFILLLAVAIALGSTAGYLLYRHTRPGWQDLCVEARASETPGAVIRVSADHGESWHVCERSEGIR